MLEGGGSSWVKLTNSIARGSIAVGGVSDRDVRSKSVGVGQVSGLSVSAPLAKTLGAPGHEGGGGSWVSSNSGQAVPVAVGWVAVGVRVAVGSIEEGGVSLGISLGLSLVETVDRLVAGSGERSSVAGGVVRSVEVGVGSIQVGWVSLSISLSAPLASAAEAGGADSRSTHAGPVGVGVVEGRVGSIDIARLSLSLAGGDGDNGSSNLQEGGSEALRVMRGREGGEGLTRSLYMLMMMILPTVVSEL